jgi:L-ascorbate metabolism protein UlaG (beta-lactamase superfamily)/glycosyltransferase involved in cell wall biosynthesis
MDEVDVKVKNKPQGVSVSMLGQAGLRLTLNRLNLYFDPYLSNSVEILHSADLIRQVPIPIFPKDVHDADFVFITHEHTDHCDPHTIPQISISSPQAKFIAPSSVAKKLIEWGINSDRIILATESWIELCPGTRFMAVPAAHPSIMRDSAGNLEFVGYLIEADEKRIYIAGDTCVSQEIIDTLIAQTPIQIAFLPVNEQNFFRERRGIIGNMSVREAFQFAEEIGVKEVVPLHWDMFAVNAVPMDEIQLTYKNMNPGFQLSINPSTLSLTEVEVSIIIRTLNEARHLEDLLIKIGKQQANGINYEVIIVDSGSTDRTLDIAARYGCRIFHIAREDFSFGRSLNMGCREALGKILVMISGHCVPVDEHWLKNLCQPIQDGFSQYSYGRQIGGPNTHISEACIFAKFFPQESCIPQVGFFCNNANSAMLKSAWEKNIFDEGLTGLEDMDLAKRLVKGGGLIAYKADAAVFHYHYESWPQVRRRYERESIALQKIMPQVHFTLTDALLFFVNSVWSDCRWSYQNKLKTLPLINIILYRWNQYLGSWIGNHQHRQLSKAEKERYFYPT